MRLIIPLCIVLLLLSSCMWLDELIEGDPKCQCPKTSAWSECRVMEAIKTRSYYTCSPQTNYTCIKYWEKRNCSREIFLKGNNGLEARISPTIDELVRHIIRIDVLEAPQGTESVVFFFYPRGVKISSNMSKEDQRKTTKLIDSDGKDGWKMLIDTRTYTNGVYHITVLPTYEDAPEDNPWLDHAQAQIKIDN